MTFLLAQCFGYMTFHTLTALKTDQISESCFNGIEVNDGTLS